MLKKLNYNSGEVYRLRWSQHSAIHLQVKEQSHTYLGSIFLVEGSISISYL